MTYILDLRPSSQPTPQESGFLNPKLHRVSVVMVAHSNLEKLSNVIKNTFSNCFVKEIVMVNCENSPRIANFLIQLSRVYTRLYVINGKSKMGLAAAYNLGAQYGSGHYYLFLNPEVEFPSKALFEMISTGLHKPVHWVIGPQCEKPAHSRLFGKLTKFCVYEQPESIKVSLLGGGFHRAELGSDCLLVPTKTFIELKGFDKKCWHSTFHIDFCLRMHLHGGNVFQTENWKIAYSKPKFKLGFAKNVIAYLRGIQGWWHFYKKYLSGKSNIILTGASICYRNVFTLFRRSEPTKLIARPKTARSLTAKTSLF